MSIRITDIVEGALYKTSSNQERLVIQIDSEGKIRYSARGGDVKGKFEHMTTSSPERFAAACSEKIKCFPSEGFAEMRKHFEDRGLLEPTEKSD